MYLRDMLADIRREPLFYEKLIDTDDQAVIGPVVSDYSDENYNRKIFLAERNPHLTEANFRALVEDRNHLVRYAVAKHTNAPMDVLNMLLADEVEEVRVQVLWNPQTEVEVFTKAVLLGKFSSSSRKGFCHHRKAVKNFEVFDFLWNTVRGGQSLLVDTLNYVVREKQEVIDPKILKVVHDEVRGGNIPKVLKESYASAVIALPEILDSWKDDPSRSIINAIARNGSAWVSTHEYLVDNYKTGEIRYCIASVTKDHALLNKIYQGTKSANLRYWVEKNPAFGDASEN